MLYMLEPLVCCVCWNHYTASAGTTHKGAAGGGWVQACYKFYFLILMTDVRLPRKFVCGLMYVAV